MFSAAEGRAFRPSLFLYAGWGRIRSGFPKPAAGRACAAARRGASPRRDGLPGTGAADRQPPAGNRTPADEKMQGGLAKTAGNPYNKGITIVKREYAMKYLMGRRGFALKVMEKAVPEPGPGQALVRVFGCGVCGTDLHFLRVCDDWTALGHEISGEVAAVGSGVRAVAVGDRVVVEDVGACGRCAACQNGKPELCTDMLTLDGQSGMGEYLVVPESMLVQCGGLKPLEACFVEPLTVCVHAVQATQLPPCGTLAVWGLGPLGLMSICAARCFGAGRIVAVASKRGTARNLHRSQLAMELGADAVLYSDDSDFKAQLDALGGRIDAALVTSPPATLPAAVETVSYGGRVVPIGIDLGGGSRVTLDVDHLILQKKTIAPVLSEPALQFPLSVELLRRGVVPVDRLLTHQVRLTDTEGLQRIFREDPTVIKVIVTPED